MLPLVPEDSQRAETAATRAALGDFYKTAQMVALFGRGAHAHAESERASSRVQRILKAAISPMDTGDAAGLVELATLGEVFAASLVGISVFDTLLAGGMRKAPLRQRGIIITTAPVGASVGEGAPKPISQMSLADALLSPQKIWCAVAASKELLDFSKPGALQLFSAELRAAAVRAIDAAFLAQLYAATTPTASAGSSFANTMVDISALLAAVDVQPTSRVYWIVTSALIKTLSVMLTTGSFAFPGLTLNGGPICGGIVVLVSDELPTDSSLLVVSDGLVGNAEGFVPRRITQGDIQINDSPDNPSTAATVLRSMWQHNISALSLERYFAFEVARARSVASLSY